MEQNIKITKNIMMYLEIANKAQNKLSYRSYFTFNVILFNLQYLNVKQVFQIFNFQNYFLVLIKTFTLYIKYISYAE